MSDSFFIRKNTSSPCRILHCVLLAGFFICVESVDAYSLDVTYGWLRQLYYNLDVIVDDQRGSGYMLRVTIAAHLAGIVILNIRFVESHFSITFNGNLVNEIGVTSLNIEQ